MGPGFAMLLPSSRTQEVSENDLAKKCREPALFCPEAAHDILLWDQFLRPPLPAPPCSTQAFRKKRVRNFLRAKTLRHRPAHTLLISRSYLPRE